MARRIYKRDKNGRFARKNGANANRAGESGSARSKRLKAANKRESRLKQARRRRQDLSRDTKGSRGEGYSRKRKFAVGFAAASINPIAGTQIADGYLHSAKGSGVRGFRAASKARSRQRRSSAIAVAMGRY